MNSHYVLQEFWNQKGREGGEMDNLYEWPQVCEAAVRLVTQTWSQGQKIKFSEVNIQAPPSKVSYTTTVYSRWSVKKVFLKISQNSQENTCASVSFLRKRVWHRWFPVNFAISLREPSLQNTFGGCFCSAKHLIINQGKRYI